MLVWKTIMTKSNIIYGKLPRKRTAEEEHKRFMSLADEAMKALDRFNKLFKETMSDK